MGLLTKDDVPLNNEYLINPLPSYHERSDSNTFSAWSQAGELGRNETDNFGRMYTKYLYSRTPIAYIEMGRPRMYGSPISEWAMSSEEKAMRDHILNALNNNNPEELDAANDAIAKDNGMNKGNPSRFYSFTNSWASYIQAVEGIMGMFGKYMQMDSSMIEAVIHTQRLSREKDFFAKLSTAASSVEMNRLLVRIEKNSSMSDGFSNDISESQVQSRLKDIGDTARELRFLTGTTEYDTSSSGAGLSSLYGGSPGEMASDGIGGIIGGLAETITAVGDAAGMGKVIQGGGNLIFPKIYKDSSYNPSYTINIQLVAIYSNPDCIARNILLPLSYLLPAIIPIQTTYNTYASPYMIRFNSPGWGYCDMGMVTSASITRDDLSSWSYSSHTPSVINVSLTIQDMYPTMMMSYLKGNKGGNAGFMKLYEKNMQFQQFMQNLGGIPIQEAEDSLVGDFMKKYLDAIQGIKRVTSGDFWMAKMTGGRLVRGVGTALYKEVNTYKSIRSRLSPRHTSL